MTNFRPILPRETYPKLILLIKAIFYHKINFLQWLETTSPIGLYGFIFANLEKKIQILQNPDIFVSFILEINQFLHVYYTNFIKSIYLFTNFEFSQQFLVKSQIFLHIEFVPIMYEWAKAKKVPGNKIWLRSILEHCEFPSLNSFLLPWIVSAAKIQSIR